MMGHSKKKKWFILPLLALLGFSFVAAILPLHAAILPTLNHVASCETTATYTVSCTLTVDHVGDVIVVGTSAYYVDAASTDLYTLSIFDTLLNSFGTQAAVHGIEGSGTGQDCAHSGCYDGEVWSAEATTAGADTITIRWATDSTLTPSVNGIAAVVYDITGVLPGRSAASTNACAGSSEPCYSVPHLITTTTYSTFGSNTIEIASGMLGPGATNVQAGAGYTLAVPGNDAGASEYSTSISSPTNYPLGCSGCTIVGSYMWAGAVFSPANQTTTTLTTVVNTACLGACSGGNNGTSNYLLTDYFYYYSSQNVATYGQIDNVTLYVANVHINAATGYLLVLTYITSTCASGGTPPSGGNQWQLLSGNTVQVPVTNGSSGFYVHANPQSAIGANCYYAVGIMPLTTKSNGASVTGSGIKVTESSQTGITEYKYNQGSSTPVQSFYALTAKTPLDWIYIHETFPVAILSTTTTSTVTTGAATVTSTINQAGIQTSVNAYVALAIIGTMFLIPLGFKLGIGGGMFGAIIGEIIAIAGGFITGPLATISLIATVVGAAAMIYLGRASGGGGGV